MVADDGVGAGITDAPGGAVWPGRSWTYRTGRSDASGVPEGVSMAEAVSFGCWRATTDA
jgi:hypothetical protein